MCTADKYSAWLMKNCPLTCGFCEDDHDHDGDGDQDHDHEDHKDHDDKEKPCIWALIEDMKVSGIYQLPYCLYF